MTTTFDETVGADWSWQRPLGRWTVGKVVLAAFLLPMTLIYFLLASGVALASPAFRPQEPTLQAGRAIQQLQTARVITGFGVVAVLYVMHTDQGVDAMISDLLTKTLWAMAIGVVALVAGIVLIYGLAGPDGRHYIQSRVRYPVVTVFMAAGSGAVFWGINWLSNQPLPGIVHFLVMAWGVLQIGFLLRMMFLVTKHVFNSADVHPLLPSLLTPIIVWALTAFALLGDVALPAGVNAMVTIGGAVTISVLAAAEWMVLRRRNPGLSLRDGLWNDTAQGTT